MIGKNPILIVLCGLPGAGKTTVAAKLKKHLNFKVIDQNEIRRKIGMKRITPHRQEVVLGQIDRLIAKTLNSGKDVILDSVNKLTYRRNQCCGIASSCGAKVIILEVVCSEELAKSRMRERPGSDGLISDPNNTKIYDRIKEQWEDIMAHDFKWIEGSTHVSYIQYDSQNNSVKRMVLRERMQTSIRRIEKVITTI